MKTAVRIFCFLLLVAVSRSQAQVIQLPSMHTFSVETTVSVPDSGGAYLGGVSRSSQGSTRRGWSPLSPSRSSGSSVSAGGMSVRATVIDHEELDGLVLREAAARRGADAGTPEDRPPTRSSSSAASGSASLSAIRGAIARDDAIREQEAAAVFEKAVAAEEESRWQLARTYYRLAAEKSPGVVKAKALQRLQTLQGKHNSENK